MNTHRTSFGFLVAGLLFAAASLGHASQSSAASTAKEQELFAAEEIARVLEQLNVETDKRVQQSIDAWIAALNATVSEPVPQPVLVERVVTNAEGQPNG